MQQNGVGSSGGSMLSAWSESDERGNSGSRRKEQREVMQKMELPKQEIGTGAAASVLVVGMLPELTGRTETSMELANDLQREVFPAWCHCIINKSLEDKKALTSYDPTRYNFEMV